MDQVIDTLNGWFAYLMVSLSMPILFYMVLLIGMVFFIHQLHRILKEDNPIDWWQFISSPGRDGIERADISKLGQVVGIGLVSFVVLYLTSQVKDLTWEGLAPVLLIALAYLGGVQSYQSYLRTKTPDKPKETP